MAWVAHFSCCAAINPVMGIGKGSSLGTPLALEKGTPGHKFRTTLQVGSGILDCGRESRHCECLDIGAGW